MDKKVTIKIYPDGASPYSWSEVVIYHVPVIIGTWGVKPSKTKKLQDLILHRNEEDWILFETIVPFPNETGWIQHIKNYALSKSVKHAIAYEDTDLFHVGLKILRGHARPTTD